MLMFWWTMTSIPASQRQQHALRTQFSQRRVSWEWTSRLSSTLNSLMYRSTERERERERDGMGLWKHAAHPPPPPHPHEFRYSSDAVQERSAHTSTVLTFKPTQQDWRIRRQHAHNYPALHSICEVSLINVYIFNVLERKPATETLNPLLEFPQGEIEH